ncbi:hypothetical protein J3T78_04585 [Staphylococcus nepalensis]|uniref:Uncharacterized protein n=1 Tax=Staphylococcus nepalensis TaxID=214473 RepID=A0ABS3L065_9STAP|nr:hypothetical protein [Staphylococcus nepalensis]MBO1213796.1 hypothetical protein [Staphylococcus nepalensis]MBO1214983.1 hypothetical protein [Staphylococcus nepalensis]MBO1226939.1 hypothetical protein [Staphylococcus nepalensis]MBO1234053.1 hypothetical protein [Staphylococcus nepalensis]MBO1236986.1 hypothetical protein [Staphylococcus nepalensis]
MGLINLGETIIELRKENEKLARENVHLKKENKHLKEILGEFNEFIDRNFEG